MGFNSETGEARSGKSMIGLLQVHSVQGAQKQWLHMASVCVWAIQEEHKVKAWVGALAELMSLHKASCKTQPDV